MVAITVTTKGKPTINLDFPGRHPQDVTVRELKTAVQAKFPKLVPNRQRFTLPAKTGKPVPLIDETKTLASYDVPEGATLRLKDLGRQVQYRSLYLWEYIGPPFINPLLLHYSYLLWGKFEPSALQYAVRNYIVLHFVKRFLESVFVHDFSRDTVPMAYVFRNSLYYWSVAGLLIGLTLYRPAYSATALKGSILNDPTWITFWSSFIFLMELLNGYSHLHLRSLRVPKGQPRKYPTTLGFGTVVCANYFYEIMAIIGLLIMTGFDLGSVVYAVIGTTFMIIWAGQKYARYEKEMDPKVFPGKRWKMFPFVY